VRRGVDFRKSFRGSFRDSRGGMQITATIFAPLKHLDRPSGSG